MNHEKIPLVLGITGHRNLHPEEFDLIRARLKEVVDCLRESYPHTPLKLLSPLAEGADRLVAHFALEEGIQLVAPLPFAKDDYCRDFKTEESLKEFNDLLEQADAFSLPQLSEGSEVKKSPERFAQYTLVGAYIARHSHVLIALWDGRKQPNPGSTYEVIQFRLTGDMQALPAAYQPPTNPLDFVDTGKVCHIKVSRENDPQRFIDAGSIHILAPEQEIPSRDLGTLRSQAFRQIDQFNQDVSEYQAQHGQIEFNKGKMFKNAKFDTAKLSPPFKNMARVYELASFLSVQNHRPTEHAMRWIFMIGALMVLAVEFYAHPPWLHSGEYPNWLLGVYFALFIGGYTLYRWANSRQIHDKYLQYRGLAEALRVQMFWQLGGLNMSVADFYQRKHRNELEWIRSAVRALSIHNWVHDQHSIDVVLDDWINKQIKYFERRSLDNHRNMRRLSSIAGSLFLSGLGLTAIVFLWGWFPDSIHHQHALHSSLIVLMVFLPAVGAALDGYLEKAGFDAHFKRYREMALLFRRAEQALRQPNSDADAQRRVLLELGKAALEENSDWLLLHRERPVAPPKV